MEQSIPSSFFGLLVKFQPLFTAPTFENFLILATGWILCTGRHSLSRILRFGLVGLDPKHHSIFYRVFCRAAWEVEKLTPILVALVLPLIPAGMLIYCLVDETLSRRSGPQLWGAGSHYDPLNSNYKGKKKIHTFANGHSWVIVSFWVPFPWNLQRGIALAVGCRLYVPEKFSAPGQYRTRTTLAREIIDEVETLVPAERSLVQVADNEFACVTCVQNLPQRVASLVRMGMTAAFYAPPGPYQGKGRRRKKGNRLPSPVALAADDTIPWEEMTVFIYGREVRVLVKTQVGYWYHVAGPRLGRMLVTRDPKGRSEDRAYFCTDATWTPEEMMVGFSRRWPSEVMHRDLKQHLGLGEAQNGWWRRPAGERNHKEKAGPQPDATRGQLAVTRTVPLLLLVYTVVVVWYFKHGNPQQDVARIRKWSPWYRQKEEVSFADMLASARRAFWEKRLFVEGLESKGSTKISEPLWELLFYS